MIAGATLRLAAGSALGFFYAFCFLSGTSAAYCCENEKTVKNNKTCVCVRARVCACVTVLVGEAVRVCLLV